MNSLRYPEVPQRVAQNEIFTFGVAFHFFVAGYSRYNHRHFKFKMWVEHSKSQPTDDNLSLKGAWSLSRDLFNVLGNKRSRKRYKNLIVSIKSEWEVVCALSNGTLCC